MVEKQNEVEIGSTKYRMLILFIFCIYSSSNSVQWIEYSILPDIFTEYYQVSYAAISWTAMISSVMMALFLIPGSLLLEYTNLRTIVLIGSGLNTAGAIIKCFSDDPTLAWLTFIGQGISGMTMPLLLQVPPRLAAVWFPSNEVSTATSIGVLGNQVGIALGFLIPPQIVKGPINVFNNNGSYPLDWSNATLYPDKAAEAVQVVSSQVQTLFIVIAVICSVSLLINIFLFKNEPLLPPSAAEYYRRIGGASEEASHWEVYGNSLKALFKDRSFLLLIVSYGLNGGCFYTISTLINQIVKPSLRELNFTSAELDAKIGGMGLLLVLAGLVGSVLGGIVLDKTKRFKTVTIVTYIFTLLFMAGFTGLLSQAIIALDFVLIAFLGFFMTGYLPIGFEFAAEITYPQSEATSSALLNMAVAIFALIITAGCQELLDGNGYSDEAASLYANVVMVASLIIGTILTVLTTEVLNRQNASQMKDQNNNQIGNKDLKEDD